MKLFKGGASYKSLGTSDICTCPVEHYSNRIVLTNVFTFEAVTTYEIMEHVEPFNIYYLQGVFKQLSTKIIFLITVLDFSAILDRRNSTASRNIHGTYFTYLCRSE
jgi:hypothetical protein